MRSCFKILVVSSLESFPTYAILMTSLVPANRKRERVAELFSKNCRDLIAKKLILFRIGIRN